jgi:peptidoglycan/xylan/chitin deacetylase (PgdA/CDA1 family)
MSTLQKIYTRLLRAGLHLQRDLAGRIGLYHNFFKSAKGQRIIIYHGVCEKDPLRFNSLFITRETFEKHLQFYKKYFNVISVDDFYHKRFDPNRFNICLTFDDGFANNYNYVLPLLNQYQVPATFFVTAIRNEGSDILWNDFLTISSVTGPREITFRDELFIKQKNNTYFSARTGRTLADSLRDQTFPAKQAFMDLVEPLAASWTTVPEDYWLQMTTEEIKQASQSPFVTIGSHGYYHNDLARIPDEMLRKELKESKYFLEETIQKPVTQIAFPYGSYSTNTVVECINAGYEQLLATEFSAPGNPNNRMRERMGINPYISTLNQMYSIVTGKYA